MPKLNVGDQALFIWLMSSQVNFACSCQKEAPKSINCDTMTIDTIGIDTMTIDTMAIDHIWLFTTSR